MTDQATIDQVLRIAEQAGAAILEVYGRDDFDVEKKGDDSPLTAADMAAHRIIVSGLQALAEKLPVHSEESEGITWEQRRDWSRYWLVDPLDGTKEFIKRNGEFTVNIALMENGEPVAGVVHVPVKQVTYVGGVGLGAWKVEDGIYHAISTRPLGSEVVMVASRSHGSDRLGDLETLIEEKVGPVDRTSMGSSLKLCLVAEGKADIYPRLAPTSEWDTAAADAVVRAAGGSVVRTDFQPLGYNKEDILNPHFLVLGDSPSKWSFLSTVL
ncbi:MAG: 3'(2'),5'-bisphosphate nucleotidase CysQ [Alcanivoracaceae bacterium]|jgi:3'(2'), 5'-bisphosphate nucleotidase|nr:3'(2'),5'-bisphosphate nucleotidase CysQ [Alcanivoracaceae bacterium]